MASIRELIDNYINNEGGKAQLETRGGKEGVFFTDREEFIPFDDLGYSSELGFFSISDFPFMESEAD